MMALRQRVCFPPPPESNLNRKSVQELCAALQFVVDENRERAKRAAHPPQADSDGAQEAAAAREAEVALRMEAATGIVDRFVKATVQFLKSCCAEPTFDPALKAKLVADNSVTFHVQFLTSRDANRGRSLVFGRHGMIAMCVVRDAQGPGSTFRRVVSGATAIVESGNSGAFELEKLLVKKRKRRAEQDDSNSDAESLICEGSDADDAEFGDSDAEEGQPSTSRAAGAIRPRRRRFECTSALRRECIQDLRSGFQHLRKSGEAPVEGTSNGAVMGRRMETASSAKSTEKGRSKKELVPQAGPESGVVAVFFVGMDGVAYLGFPHRQEPNAAVARSTEAVGDDTREALPGAEDDVASKSALGSADVDESRLPAVDVPSNGFIQSALDFWKLQQQLPHQD